MKLNYKYRKSVTLWFYIILISFIVSVCAFILHTVLMSEYTLVYVNAEITIYFPAVNGMTEKFRDCLTLFVIGTVAHTLPKWPHAARFYGMLKIR
jgi:hypothetical protein